MINCYINNALADDTYNSNAIIDNINESNNSLTIAERDVLFFQLIPNINTTANLTLLVNREIWIMNNDNVTKNITIRNTIPKNDFIQTSLYPSFGYNMRMPLNLIQSVQDYINPNNTTLLNEPEIQVEKDNVNYTWNNITIGPKDDVIIVYINYYDNLSNMYNMTNINLPDMVINRSYNKIHMSDNNYSFIMNYTMKNIGGLQLSTPTLILFFPEIVDGIQLIKPTNISVNSLSQSDIIENDNYNDGTGQMSNGHLFLTNFPVYLDANNQYEFDVTINGSIINNGKIFPSLIVSYNYETDPTNSTGLMTRIWPETQIISQNMSITRLYYYDVDVFIPEDNYFTTTTIDNKASEPMFITILAFIISSILVLYTKRK